MHTGLVLGRRRSPAPPLPPIPGSPRAVLDALLAAALARGRCHVLFSGGRDSAAMLAVATDVARRRGLPDPVPLTARFAEHPRAWETDWQERVVRHLGLRDWDRFEVTDELDALGALATGALARHGPYWPGNAHTMLLFAARAAGGTVLTGGGGDELFSPWGWRRLRVTELRRLRPRRRIAKWALFSALPLRSRQALLLRRRSPIDVPWVRPATLAALDASLRDERPARTWPDDLEDYLDGRYLELVRGTVSAFAEEAGTHLVEPFYDPRFVRAVAATGPNEGFADRGDALHAHFHDLLPCDVLYRSTKATFTEATWGPAARAFIERWDGRGLDESLVDPTRVAKAWRKPVPDFRTVTLLHRAWLWQRGIQAPATSSSS